MSTGGSKRAVAEIRFGEDRAGVAKVGGRSIHQYWSMLAPHFRDVFLSPQRRSDDGGVSWTWREPAEKDTLTAAELASVRSRLERAKDSFEENPVNPLMTEARGGGASSQEIIDQLTARVKALAEGLAGKPDAALAEYVCRTETGVMVHSWGLNTAAKISYPDSQESAISGVVMFGGKGSAGNDVVIENARGLRVARITTDEAGEFNFTKLAPGKYQVRVISGPGEFSKKGVSVTVERGETSRIELRSTSDPAAPAADGAAESEEQGSANDTSAPVAIRKRRKWLWVAAALLLLIGGGGWMWHSYFRSSQLETQTAQRISTLTPEKFSSEKPSHQSEAPSHKGAGIGAALGAVADGQGESKSSPPLHETRSVDMPSLSSTPETATASSSKIGTRVELSGVNTAGVNARPSAGTGNLSRGMAAQASAGAASTENVSDSAEPQTGAEADSSSESVTAARTAATKPTGETGSPKGGPASDALSGSMPAGGSGAMPSSPAGSEADKKMGMAVDAGFGTDHKKTDSKKAIGLPVADREKKGLSPGDNMPASAENDAAAAGQGVRQISGQGPAVAVTVVEKPSSKLQTPAATGEGNQANPPAEIPSPSSPPDNSAKSAGKPGSRKVPKAEHESSAQDSRADSGSSEAGPATSSGSAASVSGKGESDKSEKDETPGTANKSSEAPLDAAPSVGDAGDKTPAAASDQKTAEKTARTARVPSVVQSKPLPVGMQVMGSVKLGEWRLRLGRDAIVPTLPLRDGEKDQSETLRRKMIEEQKLRMPATLRGPALVSGFAFKFAAGAKIQPLHWLAEERAGLKLTVLENRAELSWTPVSGSREGVFTLAHSDGAEVARVEFDRTGVVTVAVKPELRAMFLLGVLYAEADTSGSSSTPHIAWQVVRGPLASTAWTYDSRWQEGKGCRLEVVLTGANPAQTRLALVDQASGWQLSTDLE